VGLELVVEAESEEVRQRRHGGNPGFPDGFEEASRVVDQVGDVDQVRTDLPEDLPEKGFQLGPVIGVLETAVGHPVQVDHVDGKVVVDIGGKQLPRPLLAPGDGRENGRLVAEPASERASSRV
jgi:hypothetical protein